MAVKLLNKSVALFDRTIVVLAIFAGLLIVLMMLAVCVDVVLRYFFNRPIVGIIEFAELGIVAITFLGGAWVLKKEGHVAIDLMLGRLSTRKQASLNAITSIIGIIICLALTWYGTKVAIDQFQRGILTFTMIRLPTYPRYVIIALGGLLLSIQFLRRAIAYMKGAKPPPEDHELI